MISIVIPAYRSRDSLPILIGRLETVLGGLGREFEIIVVDDCSPDDTWQVLKQLKEGREQLRILSSLEKLPEMRKDLRELKKLLQALDGK